MRQQSFLSQWTQAFRDSPVSDRNARLVGYAMATFANTDGTSIRPTVPRLMIATGLSSETSLTKGIHGLLTWGWAGRTLLPGVTEYKPVPGRAAEFHLTLPHNVAELVQIGRDDVNYRRQMKRERNESTTAERAYLRKHGHPQGPGAGAGPYLVQ